MIRFTGSILLAAVIVAFSCDTGRSSNQEPPSDTRLARSDVAKWTPSYVRTRLGDPVSKEGPFKNSYLLNYDGISFSYGAPENVESDVFQAVIIQKQDLPKAASEFVKSVPAGLKIGSTPATSISVLGEPEEVEEGDGYLWYTYNHRKGDWRKILLRFRRGKLELINISIRPHGRS